MEFGLQMMNDFSSDLMFLFLSIPFLYALSYVKCLLLTCSCVRTLLEEPVISALSLRK